MARSLALGLYLLSRRGAGVAAPERAARPQGRLFWFHVGADTPLAAAAEIARHIARDDRSVRFLVTGDAEGVPDAADWPAGTIADLAPGEQRAALLSFLAHWRPEQLTVFAGQVPPALVVAAADHAVPMVLVSPGMTRGMALSWKWRPAMARAILGRFNRIVAPDPASADRLMALSGGEVPIDIAGQIESTCEPLPHAEAEREALARLLSSRPVWMAVACPESEEEAVVAAHAHAIRYAHRSLLILVPDDPARGPAIAGRLDAQGWTVALRSREEDPEDDVQILVADTDDELGLWYRLAPVTYFGGTLLGGGPARNLLEAAVLGSAIVTGPQTAPHAEIYTRLSQARAIRLVRTEASLAEAIAELSAPDRAALLAHNAWAASTGGAEVAGRVAQAILASLLPAPATAERG